MRDIDADRECGGVGGDANVPRKVPLWPVWWNLPAGAGQVWPCPSISLLRYIALCRHVFH